MRRRTIGAALAVSLPLLPWPPAYALEPIHDKMPVESVADLGVRCELAYTAYIAIWNRDGAKSNLSGDLAERYRKHRDQMVVRTAVHLSKEMGLDPGDPASVAPAQKAYRQRFREIAADFKEWMTNEVASGRDVFASNGLVLSDIQRCEALVAVWKTED